MSYEVTAIRRRGFGPLQVSLVDGDGEPVLVQDAPYYVRQVGTVLTDNGIELFVPELINVDVPFFGEVAMEMVDNDPEVNGSHLLYYQQNGKEITINNRQYMVFLSLYAKA